jgi:hypothetical protein
VADEIDNVASWEVGKSEDKKINASTFETKKNISRPSPQLYIFFKAIRGKGIPYFLRFCDCMVRKPTR